MLNPLNLSPDVTALPIPGAMAAVDPGATQLTRNRFADFMAGAEPIPVPQASAQAPLAPAVNTEGQPGKPTVEAAPIEPAPELPSAPPIQTASPDPVAPSTHPRPAPSLATGAASDDIGTADRVRQLVRQSLPPTDPSPRATPTGKAGDHPAGELSEAEAEKPGPEGLIPGPPVAAPLNPHVAQITPEPTPDPQRPAPDPGPLMPPQPALALVAPLPVAAAPVDAPPPAPVTITAQDWPAQIADRVAAAMADSTTGRQNREISIDIAPEHLGPLRLRVSVTDKGTEISVAAAHPEVAHLLKEAQPDLQRALAEAGQPAFQHTGSGSGSSFGAQQHPGWRSTRSGPGSPDPIPDPIPSPPRADPPAAGLNLIA